MRKTPSTIRRRLSTICGFYRYCSQERPIERDPSAHVRRPKQDYESTTLDLDRNKLGAFLVQAGLCGGRDHAPACLLALNRLLFIHRKGNKTATIALSPRTARALDLYIGERETGPIFLNHDNTHRLDRHASARIVRRLPKAAGIAGRQPLNRRNRRQAIILIAHHTARIVKPVLEGVLSPFWSSISGASTPGLKCGVGRPMVV